MTNPPPAGPRTALITGASAGIGRALAEVFAENGWNLILVARRRERLEVLAADLERRRGGKARAIPADLAVPAAAARLVERLDAEGLVVDALVNNAGYGINGSFSEIPWEEQEKFLRVLLVAPTELSRRLAPGMVERGWGRIVNVASLAAFVPPRPGDSYSATKAFLVRLSRSMSLELRDTGVAVTAVCPGFTHTEFHDAMGVREQVRKLPSFFWQDAETVAREGYEAAMAGKRVVITGRLNRWIAAVAALVPDRLVYALTPKGVLNRRPGKPA